MRPPHQGHQLKIPLNLYCKTFTYAPISCYPISHKNPNPRLRARETGPVARTRTMQCLPLTRALYSDYCAVVTTLQCTCIILPSPAAMQYVASGPAALKWYLKPRPRLSFFLLRMRVHTFISYHLRPAVSFISAPPGVRDSRSGES